MIEQFPETDEKLQAEIRDLVSSRYWKLVRVFLVNRRAQLFNENVTDTNMLLKNRGALEEVNRLIHAPEQALFEFAKAKVVSGVIPEDMMPFWLGAQSNG